VYHMRPSRPRRSAGAEVGVAPSRCGEDVTTDGTAGSPRPPRMSEGSCAARQLVGMPTARAGPAECVAVVSCREDQQAEEDEIRVANRARRPSPAHAHDSCRRPRRLPPICRGGSRPLDEALSPPRTRASAARPRSARSLVDADVLVGQAHQLREHAERVGRRCRRRSRTNRAR